MVTHGMDQHGVVDPARVRSAVWRERGLALAIGTIVAFAFLPALAGGFVWDDELTLLQNPHYRGLGWRELRWMFTTVYTGHWMPLSWITYGLDYLLWGMNPAGYHVTNVLLHALNACVFYLLARRLLAYATTGLGEVALSVGAATAALFFALHPLRVESVAWVTERRDVLSGLFFLLTLLTYLKACALSGGGGRGRWRAASVALYVLAIASKSIVITLPALLVLLDVYPLGRLGRGWRGWIAPGARRVWMEKIPYALVAVAGGALALAAARAYAFLTPVSQYPLSARVAMALYSFAFYLRKTLLPTDLSPLYAAPRQVSPLTPPFLLSALAVVLITGGLILVRRRFPGGLAVWTACVLLLLPVSGLTHFGPQLVADRYSYLPCLGWSLLVGGAVGGLLEAAAHRSLFPALKRLSVGAVGLWVAGLGAITVLQAQVWRDAETLWSQALEVDPRCVICHTNLGVALGDRGDLAQAVGHFEQALFLDPDYAKARQNLGLVLLKAGQPAVAAAQFERSLEQEPGNSEVRALLAQTLMQQGKPGVALSHLEAVLRQNPAHIRVLTLTGMALIDLGRPREALAYLGRAATLEPGATLPRFWLARAYLSLGESAAAGEQAEVLRRLDPGLAQQLPK